MTPVVKAEIFKLRYTLSGYKLSYGIITEVFPILLRLQDRDGVVGWGEANPQQPFTDENADDVIRVLQSDLLPIVDSTEDPLPAAIDDLLDEIDPGKNLLAKGAVTIALLDIQAKRAAVPVAKLLGKPLRTSLQVSHPLNNGSVEDDIAVIDAKMKEGYVDYMLKMGTSPIPQEIERVKALEKRYGDRVRFKADANTGWSRDQAREFLAGVAGCRLAYVEQPVDKHDSEGMEQLAEIARASGQVLSADESLTSTASAMELIQRRAAGVFSIKITKNGGPLRAKRLIDLAKENGISIYANSMLEGGITQAASLHLAVTTENLLDIGHSFRSVLRLEGDCTNFASFIQGGIVHLPDGAGLGIAVNEEQVRREALEVYVVEGRRDI